MALRGKVAAVRIDARDGDSLRCLFAEEYHDLDFGKMAYGEVAL
jgi:hypothetical protein